MEKQEVPLKNLDEALIRFWNISLRFKNKLGEKADTLVNIYEL